MFDYILKVYVMLAQKQQEKEQAPLMPGNDLFLGSGTFYQVNKTTEGWDQNNPFLTAIPMFSLYDEGLADFSLAEGQVFLEASNQGPYTYHNVRRFGQFGLTGASVSYQTYKILESNVDTQEGKIIWMRTSDVTARSVVESDAGVRKGSKNAQLDGGNLITHEFKADKKVKRKESSGIKEYDSAFSFDLSGSSDTSQYHWLQFVWREIYGTQNTTEKFLTDKITTTGGQYYLTKDHDPKEKNINPDTGGASEPWYGGITFRTAKTAKIIDRPSSFYTKVESDVPDEWSGVHSRFHGVTYLAKDTGAKITLQHEYDFYLDWNFGDLHQSDSLLQTPLSSIKPTTTLGSTKKTNKMQSEVKKSFKKHYGTYEARLDEN